MSPSTACVLAFTRVGESAAGSAVESSVLANPRLEARPNSRPEIGPNPRLALARCLLEIAETAVV